MPAKPASTVIAVPTSQARKVRLAIDIGEEAQLVGAEFPSRSVEPQVPRALRELPKTRLQERRIGGADGPQLDGRPICQCGALAVARAEPALRHYRCGVRHAPRMSRAAGIILRNRSTRPQICACCKNRDVPEPPPRQV